MFVIDFTTFAVYNPDILITAIPETPGPVERAYIVMNLLYPEFF